MTIELNVYHTIAIAIVILIDPIIYRLPARQSATGLWFFKNTVYRYL